MMDNDFLDGLCIYNIAVISGERYEGRTVDKRLYGRSSSGILYLWSGEAKFYNEDNSVITASAGELVFIPKGMRYRMKYTALKTVFVLVNFDSMSLRGEEALLLPNITILAKDDKTNQLAKIMTAFEISGASKTVGSTLRKKELIYRLLGMIYRSNLQVTGGVNVNSKILEGVRLLEQTYLENLPITVFSDACHLSINTFRKLFHEQVGMPPLKYRNYLRIQRAKELLREGSFTVSEVAYNSGFENVGYFCRCYRSVTGENPKETKNKN